MPLLVATYESLSRFNLVNAFFLTVDMAIAYYLFQIGRRKFPSANGSIDYNHIYAPLWYGIGLCTKTLAIC